jgi:hypothetical protein
MKKILIALAILAVVGAATAYYLWNKPHENIAAAKVDAAVTAVQLFADYEANATESDAKYLGKTIAVTGEIKEITTEGANIKIILQTGKDFSVVCSLDPKPAEAHARTDFAMGETVTMKGKCDGLNLDVQLSRCVESK